MYPDSGYTPKPVIPIVTGFTPEIVAMMAESRVLLYPIFRGRGPRRLLESSMFLAWY